MDKSSDRLVNKILRIQDGQDFSDFPRVLYSSVLGTSMGFLGDSTDRVGDSFNSFVHPLSKLCVSDTHLHIREKHGFIHFAFLFLSSRPSSLPPP